MIKTILAAAAIFFLSSHVQAQSIRIAGWEIQTFPSGSEKTGCMMGADYRDGTRVSIVMLRTYTWALALHNPSWGLMKDQRIKVDAYVDNRLIASGSAEVIAPNLALFPLEGVAAYRSLQTGYRLELMTALGQVQFDLTGTAKAMRAVLQCVGILNSNSQTTAASSSRQSDDYQAVSSAEATVLLTNMFNAAAIRGYKLLPPKQDSNIVYFSMDDGSTGFFFAHRGKNTPSADNAASSVISSGSTDCKGDYLSGKQSVPSTDGSIIRKVVTTCRTNGTAIVTETTVIRRESGFLVTLGQFRPEYTGGGAANAESSSSAGTESLVDAALKIDEPK